MYPKLTPKNKQTFFKTNQELLVGFGVALVCLFSSFIFPAQNTAQIITRNLFFLVLLPAAYIKIILGKDLADFGWNLENKKVALPWSIGTTLFTLLIFYLMLNYTGLKTGYVLASYLKNSFWLFLAYELLAINFVVFVFSYFFQGFILSLFQKEFSHFAIALQTVLFVLAIFLAKALAWQTAPFILLSVTAGFLAWKTRSFFYSYFMSIFAIIILDAYIIYLTK
ncbi:MAG: hypothetical protein NTY33_02460 [Candidatus Moranbacteria bacterium]|nr:hypothetical protein [Candidatus Moranbacteria bacterium]